MSAVRNAAPETATSLAEIVERTPALVLVDREKFDEFYEEIAEEVRAFVPDLTTDKGRKAVKSLAFRVTKTKTAIDEAGKKLSEDKRREVKLIDEARKVIRDRLDDLSDEARKPLTDWEAAESVRRATRERDISELGIAAIVSPEDTSDTIAARLTPSPIDERITAPLFIDRRAGQCAWPLWGDDEPLARKRCCGRPVKAGSKVPYCDAHLAQSGVALSH